MSWMGEIILKTIPFLKDIVKKNRQKEWTILFGVIASANCLEYSTSIYQQPAAAFVK